MAGPQPIKLTHMDRRERLAKMLKDELDKVLPKQTCRSKGTSIVSYRFSGVGQARGPRVKILGDWGRGHHPHVPEQIVVGRWGAGDDNMVLLVSLDGKGWADACGAAAREALRLVQSYRGQAVFTLEEQEARECCPWCFDDPRIRCAQCARWMSFSPPTERTPQVRSRRHPAVCEECEDKVEIVCDYCGGSVSGFRIVHADDCEYLVDPRQFEGDA